MLKYRQIFADAMNSEIFENFINDYFFLPNPEQEVIKSLVSGLVARCILQGKKEGEIDMKLPYIKDKGEKELLLWETFKLGDLDEESIITSINYLQIKKIIVYTIKYEVNKYILDLSIPSIEVLFEIYKVLSNKADFASTSGMKRFDYELRLDRTNAIIYLGKEKVHKFNGAGTPLTVFEYIYDNPDADIEWADVMAKSSYNGAIGQYLTSIHIKNFLLDLFFPKREDGIIHFRPKVSIYISNTDEVNLAKENNVNTPEEKTDIGAKMYF